VRQVNLGLDFLFTAKRARRSPPGRRLCFRSAAEMGSHLFRFVFFQRAGVRFLLSHSHLREHVENGFALNFQLSGKIVDSNLTHPAFRLSAL